LSVLALLYSMASPFTIKGQGEPFFGYAGCLSSIDIPSCHHPINYDYLCPIIDLIKDSVIPDTNLVAVSCG